MNIQVYPPLSQFIKHIEHFIKKYTRKKCNTKIDMVLHVIVYNANFLYFVHRLIQLRWQILERVIQNDEHEF